MYLLMFIKPMTKLPPLARRCLSDIDLWSVATGRIPSLFRDAILYISRGSVLTYLNKELFCTLIFVAV